MRALALPALVLGLASGCAQKAEPLDPLPPRFALARGAWTASELDNDIVRCARRGREETLEHADLAGTPIVELRRAQREATVSCMNERGWIPR